MTQYAQLARTGVQVSRIALGSMNLGPWGEADHGTGIAIVHRAVDSGINLIDTADLYSAGESEVIVGTALAGRLRDDVVLATKFHGRMGADINRQGNSRRWIRTAVEDSLRRLQTDRIDLYQVHKPEPDTDIDETLGALEDLVAAGKIVSYGTSCFPAHHLVEAQWSAQRRGRGRPVTEQSPYSILTRGIERDVLPTAEKYGIGVLVWSPLAGGWLSGRTPDGRATTPSDRHRRIPARYDPELPANAEKRRVVRELSRLAAASDLTLIQLALGFVLSHRAVTTVLTGPRSIPHLDSALAADGVRLGSDVLDAIDAIVPPGTVLNHADSGYTAPELIDATRRRR
ncbi:aldo/keto reductase [Microbacterium sp. BWT-B31]|uniref:aldo/keto reductase n=1 Tax=Microbacterium sp. BWT-B31 TaxID=3232072 RepID=UPI00352790ED